MAKELVFVLEDEENIQKLIKYNLEEAGYFVATYSDGESLLKDLKETVPDLFILDIMLPGIDGLDVCKRLREIPKTKNIPIIMLTAKSEEFDKVLGLEIGSDDYITKPFSVREMNARIKALFRRSRFSSANENDIIIQDKITLDCSRREVYKNKKLIKMPLKEFELLRLLMINKGNVLSRDILLEKIWGFDYIGETRTVDVHVRYLRQKIEDDSNKPKYIETVRGIGYKFNDKPV